MICFPVVQLLVLKHAKILISLYDSILMSDFSGEADAENEKETAVPGPKVYSANHQFRDSAS